MLEYDEEKRIIKRLLQRSKEVPFHEIRDAVEAAGTPPCNIEFVLWQLLERGEAVKIMANYYDVDLLRRRRRSFPFCRDVERRAEIFRL